jgi:hypothetical protein
MEYRICNIKYDMCIYMSDVIYNTTVYDIIECMISDDYDIIETMISYDYDIQVV